MTDGPIEIFRELPVSVPDQKPVFMVAGDRFSQLLQCPFAARMGRHVTVENLPRGMLDHHEHIENLERRGDRDEEITGHDRVGVIPYERAPALIGVPTFRAIVGPLWHVLADRAWRYLETELEEEFVRNPFFSPGRILQGHPAYQGLYIPGDGRSARAGFEPPEQPKAFPMPPNQGRRLDDDQRVAPVKGLR